MLPENTDEYCSSPCISETHRVLNCIENLLSHFKFYNKASINDVRGTIKSGCSYGPKRGIHLLLEYFPQNTVHCLLVYMIFVCVWKAISMLQSTFKQNTMLPQSRVGDSAVFFFKGFCCWF